MKFVEGDEMARPAAKSTELDKLMAMAKEYGVDTNALFLSTLDTYMVQRKAVERIKEAMMEDGEITTTKEYVKGRMNVYLHPAVKELPRHADALNKTTTQMLEIIKTLGNKQDKSDPLMDFIK